MNNQKGGSIVIGYLDLLLLSSILSVAIFGSKISKEESVKRRNSSKQENTIGSEEKDFTSIYNPIKKATKFAAVTTGKFAKSTIDNTGNKIKEFKNKKIEQDKIDKTNVLKITDLLLKDS